jgi:hypothetical protein
MKMIRHEDEFVQKEFVLCAIVLQRVEEKFGHTLGPKNGATLPGDGGDEECADALGSKHSDPGLKPPFSFIGSFTTLKGGASTEAIQESGILWYIPEMPE